MTCPSELALEAHLLDPERSQVAAHLATCPSCSDRVASMVREGEEFLRLVFPQTLDAVLAKAVPRGQPHRPWSLIIPAAVAAATAVGVLLVAHRGPPDDYVGLKGPPLSLAVFVSSPSGAQRLESGAPVAAGAALRFEVSTAHHCHLWLASIDSASEVSQIYPASGAAPALLEKSGALPGGALLDGKSGRERFVAVCSPQPLAFDRVATAVRGLASQGEGGHLDGVPEGTSQASVVVEKTP